MVNTLPGHARLSDPRSRVIGVLNMTDESRCGCQTTGGTHTLDSPSRSDHVQEIADLPELLIKQIKHYFERWQDTRSRQVGES